jgi:hypothetical protein
MEAVLAVVLHNIGYIPTKAKCFVARNGTNTDDVMLSLHIQSHVPLHGNETSAL